MKIRNFLHKGLLKLYVDDNQDTLPLFGNGPWINPPPPGFKCYMLGLGGNDPAPGYDFMAVASDRPLYPYIKPSTVFRCPADHGQEEDDTFGGSIDPWPRRPE